MITTPRELTPVPPKRVRELVDRLIKEFPDCSTLELMMVIGYMIHERILLHPEENGFVLSAKGQKAVRGAA